MRLEGTNLARLFGAISRIAQSQRSCHVFSQACRDFVPVGPELDVDLQAAGWLSAGRGEGRNGNVLAVGASAGRSGDTADEAEVWQGDAGRGLWRNPRRAALAIFCRSQGAVFQPVGQSPDAGAERQ